MDLPALITSTAVLVTAATGFWALHKQGRQIQHDVNSSRSALVEAHRVAMEEMQTRLDKAQERAQDDAIAELRADLTAALAEFRAATTEEKEK